MADDLHPIELDDGNIAEEVRQALDDCQVVLAEEQAEEQARQVQEGQPTPEDIFNRIVLFERVLNDAWVNFKKDVVGELDELKHEVQEMRSMLKEQEHFTKGDSVVLLDERKIRTVRHVMPKMLDISLDEDKSKQI